MARKKKFTVDDNSAYNALASWALDTDADSFAKVFGDVFGVTVKVIVKHGVGKGVDFECTPIEGEYLDCLEAEHGED